MKLNAKTGADGTMAGRSPCGERGLKYHQEGDEGGGHRRSPCGERGLKFLLHRKAQCTTRSLPVRGAWIEIKTKPVLI